MNKYEKLIEYIINENEQKARELFHEIVVEKSRDIYESIMDEEQMSEMGGDGQQDLVDEVTADENGGVVEADDEEFDMGGDDMEGDLPADDEGSFGDEEGFDDGMGDEGMGGDEPATKADFDELKDMFAELQAQLGGESDMDTDGEFGGADAGEGDDQSGTGSGEGQIEVGAGDEEGFGESMTEGEQPEWLKKKGSGSGAKGSGSGSGAKGSGSGSGAKGSGSGAKMESKSVSQLMREYVDTIGQVYGGEGDNAEGTESGNGKKVPVNTNSVGLNKGPDFGGTSKNILNKSGATNENPDGKQTPKPNNEYSKGEGKFSNEKFQNQAGGTKKQSTVGKNWESENGAEGQTTSGKVSVQDKTVLKQNTGK